MEHLGWNHGGVGVEDFFSAKPPAALLLGDLRLMEMQRGDRRPPAEQRDFIVSELLNARFTGILKNPESRGYM